MPFGVGVDGGREDAVTQRAGHTRTVVESSRARQLAGSFIHLAGLKSLYLFRQ